MISLEMVYDYDKDSAGTLHILTAKSSLYSNLTWIFKNVE